jgi:mannose-6-phosphate isomerase-like protein (cupin superfamily)
MYVKKLRECKPFIGGDGSLLREILHPNKQEVDIRYSLAWASLAPRKKTTAHILDHAEVYHVLRGKGRMHINREVTEVIRNDTVYIPSGAVQFIENTADEDLEFLCIVDPAWRPEIERVAEEI